MSENNKTRPVQIRFSEEEYKVMKEKAQKHGLTVSAYIRLLALNDDIQLGTKETKNIREE